MKGVYILYFVIFVLTVLLLITSGLSYYYATRYKDNDNKELRVDRCPPSLERLACPACPALAACPAAPACPRVDNGNGNGNNNGIPVYPKELPSYDNNRGYQQVGILTSNDASEPIILPLFSKRANNHRDRWNYYTTTDKNTMLRLPISHENMKCDDDIGCKEIYDGNTLYIEMYKGKTFTATIYKKQTPSYFADRY
jgi:hypothetical protein